MSFHSCFMISFTIQWQLLYILGPGKTLTLCWNPPMACSPLQCPWIQCIFSQEGLSGELFGKLVTENRIRYLQKPLFNSVIVRTLESWHIVGTSLVIPTGFQLPTRRGFLLAPEGPSQWTHTFLASLPRMRWDPPGGAARLSAAASECTWPVTPSQRPPCQDVLPIHRLQSTVCGSVTTFFFSSEFSSTASPVSQLFWSTLYSLGGREQP